MDVKLFAKGGPLDGKDVLVAVNTYPTSMADDFACEDCGEAPGKDSVGGVLEMTITSADDLGEILIKDLE